MSDDKSFADKTDDWQGLLDSCEANPDLLPNSEPFRMPLAEALSRARVLKSQRDQLEGTRQATTQQLHLVLTEGSEAARRLRRFVAAHLGTKSEHLPQFGVQPIRRRRGAVKRKGKEPAASPVQEPEKPAA